MTAIPGPPYPGVYRHFRGGLYVVHRVLHDATNVKPNRLTGSIMVLYESLDTHQWAVREIREFLEFVHSDDGSAAIQHHLPRTTCRECVPRFNHVLS